MAVVTPLSTLPPKRSWVAVASPNLFFCFRLICYCRVCLTSTLSFFFSEASPAGFGLPHPQTDISQEGKEIDFLLAEVKLIFSPLSRTLHYYIFTGLLSRSFPPYFLRFFRAIFKSSIFSRCFSKHVKLHELHFFAFFGKLRE